MKKIVIGAAGAGLIVVGVASAAQLAGTSTETLAAGTVTVSGATLEGLTIENDWVGTGTGVNPKMNVVTKVTIDLDKAGVYVEGLPLNDDRTKSLGYFGPDGVSGDAKEAFKTDANGVVTVDLSAKKIPVEKLAYIDLNVFSG